MAFRQLHPTVVALALPVVLTTRDTHRTLQAEELQVSCLRQHRHAADPPG